MYLKSEDVSKQEFLQQICLIVSWSKSKRHHFKNKRIAVLEMAFRTRKVFGAFETGPQIRLRSRLHWLQVTSTLKFPLLHTWCTVFRDPFVKITYLFLNSVHLKTWGRQQWYHWLTRCTTVYTALMALRIE